MPVLVEGAEHVEGLAVQEQPPVARLEAPEPDDPLDRVDDRVADDELDDEIVEVGRVRRPGLSVGNGEPRVERSDRKW